MTVLFVEWIDATTHHSWGGASDAQELAQKTEAPCISIGFLMYETDESLVLAQNLDSENLPGNMIAIPKIAVRKRKVVKISNGKAKH